MKLAVVSPLPPDRSGVADFAERLIEELSSRATVEARRSGDADWLRSADLRLYQLGNNILHEGAYRAALAVPGVVELHDAVLHHLMLGLLGEDDYVAEHVYERGEWARGEAQRLWARRGLASSDEAFFARPLIKRVADAAQAVIVHNPGARRAVESVAPETRVEEIPHFVDVPKEPSAETVQRARATLGVGEAELLVGCFGFQRPSKRLRSVFRAAERVAGARVLVAGEFVSRDYQASLAPWLGTPLVIRREYAPEAELRELASAVDVCVNLRYPAAGETSGIAMRLMGLGKPVAVTACPETEGYPEGTVLRVDSGEAEEGMLTETLALLRSRPEVGRAVGAAGRRLLADRHAMPVVIKRYWELFGEIAGQAAF